MRPEPLIFQPRTVASPSRFNPNGLSKTGAGLIWWVFCRLADRHFVNSVF